LASIIFGWENLFYLSHQGPPNFPECSGIPSWFSSSQRLSVVTKN
jgi:hypothetical protein